jgi:hypothetical protein
MKHLLCLLVVLVLCPAAAHAEKATFDLVRYAAPPPWKKLAWNKVTEKDKVTYSLTDQSDRTYCQIFIVKSTISKGELAADFDNEWKDLIVNNYKITEPAQVTDAAEQDGWKVKAGVGTFEFNSQPSIAMLTSISGYGRTASIVAVTNNQDYLPAVQALLGSVEMIKPKVATTSATAAKPAAAKPAAAKPAAAKPAALQGYMEYSPFTKTWTWKLRYPPPQTKK